MSEQVKKEVIVYNETFPVYERRSFGLQMTDSQERINMERMRRERLERARSHMKEAGITVMLLLEDTNMRYTVGLSWLGYTTGGAYVLLPLEGEPIVFPHGAPLQDRREGGMTWIKKENIKRQVRGPSRRTKLLNPAAFEFEASQFAQQIKRSLERMRLAKEVLTLDTHSDIIPALEKEGIRTAVDDEVLVRAQVIKTQDEIACFRQLGALVDLVHYELAKYAEPGKTELELAGYMNFIAMKHGAEPRPNCLVVSGNNTHPNHFMSTDRTLRHGDIFYADTIQISWCGYKSCCYRDYSCVTPPTQAAKDAMKELVDLTYAALSDCKPGNTTADMMRHWAKHEFMRILVGGGHGLGILNYGPPNLGVETAIKFPEEIKEGMVFAIEPFQGIGDGQGVKLEEMVVVTKTGYEVLTHAPLEIVTCPLR
ncbi:M24 family metallopeptidase [Chloroflexota bacterium]